MEQMHIVITVFLYRREFLRDEKLMTKVTE